VYPPHCAYRMPRSYARNQPTSRPELYQLNLVTCGSWILELSRSWYCSITLRNHGSRSLFIFSRLGCYPKGEARGGRTPFRSPAVAGIYTVRRFGRAADPKEFLVRDNTGHRPASRKATSLTSGNDGTPAAPMRRSCGGRSAPATT
jgi:hypothetical protein